MKARFKAIIRGMNVTGDPDAMDTAVGAVILDLAIPDGLVDGVSAKRATLTARLSVKPVVAEEFHYGQALYITIDTDDPTEGGGS